MGRSGSVSPRHGRSLLRGAQEDGTDNYADMEDFIADEADEADDADNDDEEEQQSVRPSVVVGLA